MIEIPLAIAAYLVLREVLRAARTRRAFVRLVSLLPYRVLDALGKRTSPYSGPWFVFAAAWATKDWRTGR